MLIICSILQSLGCAEESIRIKNCRAHKALSIYSGKNTRDRALLSKTMANVFTVLIQISDTLTVLDCPGLVFPHSIHDFVSDAVGTAMTHSLSPQLLSIAMQHCLGVIPLAQVRECYTAVRFLAERIPLEKWYGLTLPDDWEYLLTITDDMPQDLKSEGERHEVVDQSHKTIFLRWSAYSICDAYAAKRGMRIAKTGAPDAHAAGRSILYDTVDGVVSLFFWPPGYSATLK